MITLAIICGVCAGVPAALLFANLARYRRADRAGHGGAVSVLIPARNEEANIRACVESVLANAKVDMEVLVLDDHSGDRTAEIVEAIPDSRVRLVSSKPLPPGWCGKQHACHQLAAAAAHPHLVFIDADVRLTADALPRALAFLKTSGADLASGVPRQITRTFSEKLLIPLVHFILLGFLPFGFMRRFGHPAFAAGCGQFFVARAESYRRAGGHAAIRSSGHDGIELPRAFRRAGLKTDLFDTTDLAACRMYASNAEVWAGLAKNAREGMGRPGLIVPFTLLLMLGQVLPPFLFLAELLTSANPAVLSILGVGTGLSHAARAACTRRFGQSWLGAGLHSIAILCFLGIQWRAAAREKRGQPVFWKGRPQPSVARAAALAWLCANLALGAEAVRLEDQNGSLRTMAFPAAKPIILTIADREGSKQLEPWVRALKERLGDRVAFEGVADLSRVPKPLRGLVLRRFKSTQNYPVMLDWEGAVPKRYKAVEGAANVFLLSKSGEVLKHATGQAAEALVEEFAKQALE